MSLLNRLFAKEELTDSTCSAEVLCSNWVAHPLEQPAARARAVAQEGLGEAEALTFLARIYACQRC